MRITITATGQRKLAAITPIKRLVRFLTEAAGIRLNDFSLVLVSNEEIVAINRIHLKHDYVTDVISYLLPALPGDNGLPSGEIFVNIQRADETRKKRNWDKCRELALYIAHGIDHLTGADDADKRGYLSMRRRELAWLRLAAKKGLLKGLIKK